MAYLQGTQTEAGRPLLVDEHGQGPSNNPKAPIGPAGRSPTWASYLACVGYLAPPPFETSQTMQIGLYFPRKKGRTTFVDKRPVRKSTSVWI